MSGQIAARGIEIGDCVAVLRITMFEGTKKIPAVVTAVRPDKFAVRALRGAFDDEGHDELWLLKNMKGRTWE